MNPGMILNLYGNDISLVRRYITYFLPTVGQVAIGNRPSYYKIEIEDPFGDPFGLGKLATVKWEDIKYEITDV